MKKAKIIVAVLLLTFVLSVPVVFADVSEENGLAELNQNVQEELSSLNLGGLDEIVANLDLDGQKIFSQTSFLDKVNALLSGENVDVGSFLSIVLHTFFDDFFKLVPLLFTIVAITFLCSIISSLRSKVGEASVEKIITFVCFAAIVVMLSGCVINLIKSTVDTVENLKTQMDVAFPVLLTLLASIGGVNSVSVFQPLLAVVSNIVVQVFCYLLLPLVSVMIVFCVVEHISDVKLDKFSSLFKSVFKWGSLGTFSLLTLAMMVGGAMAGSFDSLSIKATKFALNSYVPVVGGVLSDGVGLVAVSGMLIKNAVGVGGIILAVSSAIFPIISVLVFSMGLKLTAAVTQPSSTKVSALLSDLAKTVELLVAILASVGFMYLIALGIIINTANVF